MSTLTTFNTRVDQITRDDAGVLDNEVDDAILSALKTYNKDRPLIQVKEYTGDSGYDYDLPDDWVEGFSDIDGEEGIEYPSGDQEPEYLPFEEWIIYQTESAKVIRFLADSPAASESFIVKYKIPHTVSAEVSTVYANDEEAFCYLSASLCLMALANRVVQSFDSTIAADVVAYRAKSDQYAARAKEHHKKYIDHIFEEEPSKAAIMVKEFDTTYPWGGSFLTHEPEYR